MKLSIDDFNGVEPSASFSAPAAVGSILPYMTDTPLTDKIGLIAGNGQLPFMLARAAKDQNVAVTAAGVRGDTAVWLRFIVDEFSFFRVGELEALLQYFRRSGVKDVIMAGQINPDHLFDERLNLDPAAKALMQALKDRKTDTIFSAVADKLAEFDLKLLDSTLLLKKYLAPPGTLSRRGPTEAELADIDFGQTIAKLMGGIDVGQTVVVKDKAIVAIEAMEGTDRCIARGCRIARRGAVVVKASKPAQDLRFDVPVVGPRTIRTMARGQSSCLAIEAGKTIVVDLETCVKMAAKAGICIVSI